MSKAAYLGIDSVSRKLSAMYVGVDGVARKVKAGYVGVNGVARQFYSANNKILKAGTYTWNDNLSLCTQDYWTFPLVFTSNGESFTSITTSYGYDMLYDDMSVVDWDDGFVYGKYKTFTIPYDQDGSVNPTGCTCGEDLHTIYDIIVANTDYLAVNGSPCVVTYDLNGGYMTGSTTKVVQEGTTIILPEPYQDGCYFGYWYCSNGGTYEAGATYIVNSNVTFTAVWGYEGGGDEGGGDEGGDDETYYTGTIILENNAVGTLRVIYEKADSSDGDASCTTTDTTEPASRTITIANIPVGETRSILSTSHTDSSASISRSSSTISYSNPTVTIEAYYS